MILRRPRWQSPRLLVPVALLGLWFLWWLATTGTRAAGASADGAAVARSSSRAAGPRPDASVKTAESREALPASDPGPGSVADPLLQFDALVEKLVDLYLAASRSVGDGDGDGDGDGKVFARLERDGEEVLRLIQYRIEEPAAKALYRLTGLPTGDRTPRGSARRLVCAGIIEQGLRRKFASCLHGGSRACLDQLVHEILACIPQDAVLASELTRLLVGAPYLGVVHEGAVLDLLTLATQDRHLIPLAAALLETLWHNLRASGARSAQELDNLAMLFRSDANPVKRLTALRHLLEADRKGYRELVIQELIERRDEELIAELTTTVAEKLPPREALRTLERLSAVTTRQLVAAFMTLGARNPKLLVAAYEHKLADGTRPDYRAELVTGAGFQGGNAGLEIARLAFANDPDLAVRTRALFVLTGQAQADEGERTLMAALDHPDFAENPAKLGDVVLALENLAARGDPNTVERVGRRLLGTGLLRTADRRRLRRILERSMPDRDADRRSMWARIQGK